MEVVSIGFEELRDCFLDVATDPVVDFLPPSFNNGIDIFGVRGNFTSLAAIGCVPVSFDAEEGCCSRITLWILRSS